MDPDKERTVPAKPVFKAQTFEVQYHSHNNPELEYKGVLDTFKPEEFTLISEKSPAVGHLVVFNFYNGTEKFLHGTAKIRAIEATDKESVRVDCEVVQADPNALKFVEKVFLERQENIQDWVSSLREV